MLDFEATASSEEDMSPVNSLLHCMGREYPRITFFLLHLSYSPTCNLKVVIAVPGHSVSVIKALKFERREGEPEQPRLLRSKAKMRRRLPELLFWDRQSLIVGSVGTETRLVAHVEL